MDIKYIIRKFGYKLIDMTTTATIKDLKEWEEIITDRVKKSGGSYCDRIEKALLENYDNVKKADGCLVIRLSNGTYKSVWDYV